MSRDAIDLLFDWRDERREEDREEDDPHPQPDARSRKWVDGRPLKPWPPRGITEEELASGPTRKCRRCERVYPETSEFFRTRGWRRRTYYYRVCIGCRRKARRQYACNNESGRTFRVRVGSMKAGAEKRGLEWGYDNPEDLREFWDAPCHYCGGKVPQRLGLDRVDSDKGYIPGNVVQCCWTCNRMKGEHPLDEWTAHMKKVLEHLESSDPSPSDPSPTEEKS